MSTEIKKDDKGEDESSKNQENFVNQRDSTDISQVDENTDNARDSGSENLGSKRTEDSSNFELISITPLPSSLDSNNTPDEQFLSPSSYFSDQSPLTDLKMINANSDNNEESKKIQSRASESYSEKESKDDSSYYENDKISNYEKIYYYIKKNRFYFLIIFFLISSIFILFLKYFLWKKDKFIEDNEKE